MMHRLLVSLILTAAIALPLPAMAQQGFLDQNPTTAGQEHQGRRGPKGGKLANNLGLTEQQQQQLQQLMQGDRENNKRMHEQIKSKRDQLRDMLSNGSGSKQQALTLHQEIHRLQGQMVETRINKIYDVKAILTPEQFTQFQSMMQQRQQQWQQKRGSRRGGGRQGGPRHEQGRRGGF